MYLCHNNCFILKTYLSHTIMSFFYFTSICCICQSINSTNTSSCFFVKTGISFARYFISATLSRYIPIVVMNVSPLFVILTSPYFPCLQIKSATASMLRSRLFPATECPMRFKFAVSSIVFILLVFCIKKDAWFHRYAPYFLCI